jgi:hypothetical protein
MRVYLPDAWRPDGQLMTTQAPMSSPVGAESAG